MVASTKAFTDADVGEFEEDSENCSITGDIKGINADLNRGSLFLRLASNRNKLKLKQKMLFKREYYCIYHIKTYITTVFPSEYIKIAPYA